MNPAERILTIYDKLNQQQFDAPMLKVWATVFDVPIEGPDLEDDITACIVALRAEIQLARVLLAEHDIPARLHGPGLDRLHATSAPGYLNTNWHSLRGNVLPPDNRISIDWACWALQDENEGTVSPDERKALSDEIASLEARLDSLTLTPYMRSFIGRQLNAIRLALRVYGIQGARPMHDALRRVVGDFKVEEGRLKAEQETGTPEAKSIWSSAAAIIEKTAKLADQGSKLKKGAEDIGALAGSAYEHIGTMIGVVKPLLLSLTSTPLP